MAQNSNDEEERTSSDGTALNDDKENPDEEDVKTAIEPREPSRKGEIRWTKMEEELRLAHEKIVEKSEKPSMWEYNPTGGVPTELANLDLTRFLISPRGQVLCFLPRDILARICSKLSVRDFLHLSLTCRFLHWRLFTFCTCYAPYEVTMGVIIGPISDFVLNKLDVLKLVYTLNNNQQGIFLRQPFCLRKPFFFDTLDCFLCVPFCAKMYYDKSLPYILAVRGLARHLTVTFHVYAIGKPFFNFSDTNDFLTAVNASHYSNLEWYPGNNYVVNNLDIFMNCPYARQMHRVNIGNLNGPVIDVPVFQNTIGTYLFPSDSAVITTLKNFLAGSTNLVYHKYFKIENHNGRFPLIEFLFEVFGEFEEFVSAHLPRGYSIHFWKKVVPMENGGLLRIIIRKAANGYSGSVTIGKEETFDEMAYKYHWICFDEGNMLWKMETAVEQDEAEESDVDEEEEQRALACLCLNNISCSIQ